MDMKVLIIGSGIYGATLARILTDNHIKCTVIEKRDHIGENVYTENKNGICFHKYGAHIIHTDDEEVWTFLNRFVHFNNYIHEVKSNYNGQLYSLPINMNTFKEFFNIEDPNKITDEHILKIQENLFYGYSAKQWGKPINEINKEVFKRLPIRKTFDNKYFSDKYQGIPIEGYTNLIESLLQGSKVKLNIKVTCDYDFSEYDVIYNTGPIDEFLNYSLGQLEYRSLKFIHKYFKDMTYQSYSVVNEASTLIPYTRTIEHKYFNYTGQKDTIITQEYPQEYNKYNEPYYPINDDKNNKLYEEYKKIAKEKFPNMIFCGRLGSYKYIDIDDAIRDAMDKANELLNNI